MKITLDAVSMAAGAAIALTVAHFVPSLDVRTAVDAAGRIPAIPMPNLPLWFWMPEMLFPPEMWWKARLLMACFVAGAVLSAFRLRSDGRSTYLRRLHRRFPTSSPPDLATFLPPGIGTLMPQPKTPEDFLFEHSGCRAKLAMQPDVTPADYFGRLTGVEGEDQRMRTRTASIQGIEKTLVGQVRDCDASPLLPAMRLALDICLAEPDAKKRIAALDDMAACAWSEIGASAGRIAVVPKLDGFFRRHRKAYPEAHRVFSAHHHHPCTQMLAQLEAVRKATDMPVSATFVWLRHADPLLWHVVDNAGKKAFSVDGIGPIAHYEAEKAARGPIATPSVADAALSIVDLCISRHPKDAGPAS